MPAINVSRTDTFEQQRVKINQIADDLFDITGGSGGASISPSAISIQDGTRFTPALSFQSDTTLGLYKNDAKTLGFVSDSNLVLTISNFGSSFENNFYLRKNFLTTAGISIQETGSEYDVGVFTNVNLFGGSGVGAEATVTVAEYNGEQTANSNVDEYITGSYTNIPLGGGSGTGAIANFNINTTEVATKGIIINAGSGYYPGLYTNVALQGGTGNGKVADITITGDIQFASTISNPGSGYVDGQYLDVSVSNVPTSTYSLTVANRKQLLFTYGRVYEWNVTDDGLNTDFVFTAVSGTASSGNDIAIAVQLGDYLIINVNSPGHPFWIQTAAGAYDSDSVLIEADGITNNGTDNGTIIWDTSEVFEGTYYYVCENHSAMNGTITIATNTGNSFAVGDVVTSATGSATIVNFDDQLGALYFSSVTGSFSEGQEITASGVAYGVAKSTAVDKNQYLIDGNDVTLLNFSVNPSQTIRFNTSDVSNLGYSPGITDGFGVGLNSTYFDIHSYGTPGNADSYFLLTITSDYVDSNVFAIGLSPNIGPDGVKTSFAISSTPAIGQTIIDQTVDVVVSGGSIISWTINDVGRNWNPGDQVTVDASLLGGSGSGLLVSYNTITITGTVTSLVETTTGSGYVEDDILTFPSTITKNYGSGFQYRISNRRELTDIQFVSRGSDYVIGDILTLPPDPGTYGGDDSFEFEITKIGTIEDIVITNGGKNYYPGDELILDRSALVADPLLLSGNEIDSNISVNLVDQDTIITADNDGSFTVNGSITSDTVLADTLTANNSVVSLAGFIQNLSVNNITPHQTNNLSISAPLGNINIDAGNIFSGGVNGTTITVVPLTGNITTTGVLKTTNQLNVNNLLYITDTEISSTNGLDIILSPDTGRVVKIDAESALTVPVGNTNARPPLGFATDGQIRYNTDTNQYEGYSSQSTSWSSLGGVRDLDGNTFILAEETVGANDNTLWFFNDGLNSIRVTPSYLEFINTKKVRSLNVSAPDYNEWTSSTPVNVGDYLKYGNNIFEVYTAGTTGNSGEEPTDTSGNLFTNGTADLIYFGSAVANLTFEEINEIQIGPNASLPVVISNDLRLVDNKVSTDVNDLILDPNTGKKVVVDATTSLVVPVGSIAERGIPSRGSIRFNTQTFTYEGYDGTNWGSLGGVKDVDQNTYIIPETFPGANENILYFFNNGNNTLNVTTSELQLRGIDVISSPISNQIELTASTIFFDNAATTLDNSSATRTFLYSSKQNFDIGLSTGLNTDPILRLDDQGDVYFNIGFGTGTYEGVKVFDGELKDFELADFRIVTETISLDKGTIDNGSTDIYSTSVGAGAKVTLVAENKTTSEKEFLELGIIDDGTDVFHTEYGNVRSGQNLFDVSVELTVNNTVRISVDLNPSLTVGNLVDVKIVSQITKK